MSSTGQPRSATRALQAVSRLVVVLDASLADSGPRGTSTCKVQARDLLLVFLLGRKCRHPLPSVLPEAPGRIPGLLGRLEGE
jgi:hypothetical protein